MSPIVHLPSGSRARPDLYAAARVRRRPRLIVLWDFGVAAAAASGLGAAHGVGPGRVWEFTALTLALLVAGPLAIHGLGGHDTATRPLGSGPLDWGKLMLASAFALWLVTLMFEYRGVDTDVTTMTVVWVLTGTGWYAGRALSRLRLRRSPQATLVVGSGDSARQVVTIARRHPEHGLDVVGLVDEGIDDLPAGFPPLLGTIADLPLLVTGMGVKRVIVAYSQDPDGELVDTLRLVSGLPGVRTQLVPRIWELVDHGAHVDALGALALVEIAPGRVNAGRAAVKRTLDLVVSAAGLAVAAPLLVAIAVAIRLESPGSSLFRQRRVGRGGREFDILKFRSMYRDADARGLAAEMARADRGEVGVADMVAAAELMKQADDPRITRVGRFIRCTSLDELPQLWNVLRGDMSLVGPRPLRPYEVATLTDAQLHRHDVRPGITGSWQVLGRSDISWDERMGMDVAYARNTSLRQDLRILARTASVVLGCRGSR